MSINLLLEEHPYYKNGVVDRIAHTKNSITYLDDIKPECLQDFLRELFRTIYNREKSAQTQQLNITISKASRLLGRDYKIIDLTENMRIIVENHIELLANQHATRMCQQFAQGIPFSNETTTDMRKKLHRLYPSPKIGPEDFPDLKNIIEKRPPP